MDAKSIPGETIGQISPRLGLNERPSTLLGIALAGCIFNWIVAPSVYQITTGRQLFSSSTSQPAMPIAPHDLIALSILGPLLGLAALLIGNILWRRGAIEKIGLTVRQLATDGIRRGTIAVMIIVPLMFLIELATEHFYRAINFEHPAEHDLLRILGEEPRKTIRAAVIFSAIFLAPFFEEFLFRGMLQTMLLGLFRRRWAAILITSILFTAVHMALWMAPPIFLLSLCLGLAYEWTDNLWVPLMVHAAFNAASVILFLHFR